jgi:hypothetical protein
MLDIEKELKLISQQKQRPGDALRERTRVLVQFECRRVCPASEQRGRQAKTPRVFKWTAGFTAAAAVVLALLLVLSPVPTAKAAGYYTIDINPSITLRVDSDNNVLLASAGNNDAAALLDGLALLGLPVGDALESIVRAAAQAGYFYERRHVLVAHFGDTPGLSEQQAKDIVSGVAGEAVSVMLLQSTKDEFENAEKDHKNAGVELLKRNARGLGIDETMDMDSMISAIQEKKTQGHGTDNQSNGKPDTGSDISNSQNASQQDGKPQPDNAGQQNGSNGRSESKETDKSDTVSGKPDSIETGKPDSKETGKPEAIPPKKASNVPDAVKEQGKKP